MYLTVRALFFWSVILRLESVIHELDSADAGRVA